MHFLKVAFTKLISFSVRSTTRKSWARKSIRAIGITYECSNGGRRDVTCAISRSRERAHLARSWCLSPANTKPPPDRPSAERNARRFGRDLAQRREEGKRERERERESLRLPEEKRIAAKVMDWSKSYASCSFSHAARECSPSRERHPGNSCPFPTLLVSRSSIISIPRKHIASHSSEI